MGWLWASSSPPKAPEPTTTSSPPPPTAAPKTPPDDMDPELSKFLAELQADLKPQSKTTSTPPTTSPSTSSSSKTPPSPLSSTLKSYLPFLASKSSAKEPPPLPTSTSKSPTPGSEALAESLLPTDMSCQQAFDLAYGCQSLGGQWNAIYRNGTLRSCSELWDDFWFCMRARGMTGAMREAAIRAHYRAKELRKYGDRPSSEDVWRSRDAKVEPGTAFTVPYVPDDMTDEEWRAFEMERRRAIRERLGLEAEK